MKKAVAVILSLSLLALSFNAQARNTPCSGKKGGIAHCSGNKFFCKNGTMSQSKQSCTRN